MQTDDSIPLPEPTFLILLSLAPGPLHGYAIMKDVQELSNQRVELSTGTLYGALKRLLNQGWIERIDESSIDQGSRGRKAYKLTPRGRSVLEAEISRLNELVQLARQQTFNGAA
jgi:DNA-binding PadR family transcriptional regulator